MRIELPVVADTRPGGTRYYIDNKEINWLVAAPVDAQYVVLTANSTLTDERVLAVDSPLDLTDGGAGNDVTIGFSDQAANVVFAGPASGGAAAPAFRALVDADIPASIARDSELHDAVTLAADAAVLLDLSGQELQLDAQAANTVFAGPASGGAADPTFRALVAADLPSHTHSHDTDLTGVSANDHHNQSHVLAGTGGLGADHTVSGLSAGQYLRATGATTAAFQAVQDSDLPSTIVRTSRTITAGVGLTGGGDLSANRTISMGTPGTLSDSTGNAATGTTHYHAITCSSNPGATSEILETDASGYLQLARLGAGAAPSYPIHGQTTSSRGVYGYASTSGVGVYAQSATGHGLVADLTGAGTSIADFRDNGTSVLRVGDGRTLTVANTTWLGLGASDGRIIFTNDVTDRIEFYSCYVGIGGATGYRLSIYENRASNYAVYIDNDGGVANRYGVLVQAGANDGSGTTYYYSCTDGDGDVVGYLANVSGTFQLVDASDERTKTNVRDTALDGLAAVEALRVVDFKRKKTPDGPELTGLIAQEVIEVYPQAVGVYKDGLMGVSREQLVPVLIKAIQQLSVRVVELERGRL